MASEYVVRLFRDSLTTPWGFRVQGGSDFHTPLIIQRVFTGSPAEGELQRGDIVVGIENYDATGMLHKEAQDLIKGSGGTLTLAIKKQGGSRDRGKSVGAVQGRGSYQPQPQAYRSGGPDFGVQYGSPTTRAQQPHTIQRTLPSVAHNRQSTAVSEHMMDRVNQSLASMDLYAASRRAQDDEEIDYSFTQQSVNERKKAFMNHPSQSHYYSVPRNNASSNAANRLRFSKKNFDPAFGTRVPDFGWSPSMDVLRTARMNASSSAGFEQDSYLPSLGQGRPQSPIPRGHVTGVSTAPARNSPANHKQPGQQRYSTSVRLNNTAPVAVAARPAFSSPPDPRIQHKQYNSPMSMYSNQHIVAAMEGQTGIPVASAMGNNVGGHQGPDIHQSPVYKLVHDQDRRKGPVRQQQWERQQSEVGVSDF